MHVVNERKLWATALTVLLSVACAKRITPVNSPAEAPPEATSPGGEWAPLTAVEIERAGPLGGPFAGWNPQNNTFGLCQWECESRVSEHVLECYVGRPADEPVVLVAEGGPDRLRAAGILATPRGQPEAPFGGAILSTRFTLHDEEVGTCSWQLVATPQRGAPKTLATGGLAEGCFGEPSLNRYVSPDRGAFALWVEHEGDHGCAPNEVVVVRTPTGR